MNRLPRARQVNVLNLLLEGCSIRSTARLTGVHKTTIASLLVDVGGHCQALLDHHLRNLTCPIIEADEIWTFVQKKQHRLTVAERADQAIGDQYAFVGFDPTSKLVVAHVIGKRDAETTTLFMEQLRSRVPGRIQFFTDGFPEYGRTIDGLYGTAIDYAQVIKPIPSTDPGEPGSLHIVTRVGHPNPRHIGTSYVERNNLTMRQHIRRFTRKSLGFSKTLRNLRAALALFFAYYNFCRVHGALRMTPAMALKREGHDLSPFSRPVDLQVAGLVTQVDVVPYLLNGVPIEGRFMNGTTALRMFFGVAKNQKHQRVVHYHNGDILTEALLRMTQAMALGITDTIWELEALMPN